MEEARGLQKRDLTPTRPKPEHPRKPNFTELKLTDDEVAEIDFRLEALRPYLKTDPLPFKTAK